jgi:hypothetical protein
MGADPLVDPNQGGNMGGMISAAGGALDAYNAQSEQMARENAKPMDLRNQLRTGMTEMLARGGGLENAQRAHQGDTNNLMANIYGFDKYMDQNTLKQRGSQSDYGILGVNMSPDEMTERYGHDYERRVGPSWWRRALGAAAAGAATYFTGGAAAPMAGSIYGAVAGQGGTRKGD